MARALSATAIAVVVALASAAPRIALAAGGLPEAARPFLWPDMLDTYRHLGGGFPYWEVPFYYPPLVGYLAGALVKLNVSAAAFLLVWAVLVAAAAGVVAAMLSRAAGRRTALVYWAAAPQLLLFSGINFDALAVLCAVAAVVLARAHRPVAALVTLAIGTCVKVFPAALAPLQLDGLRHDRRRLVAGTVVFAGIVVAISLPSLLAPAPSTYTVPDYASKVTIESAWGLVHAVLAVLGLEDLVGPITVAGLLATYAFGVVPAARRHADPAVGAGLAVVTVLLWSRIYQPQYSLWVIPFIALAAIPFRWYALLTVADVGVFVALMLIEAASLAASAPVGLIGVLAAAVAMRHASLVGIWVALYRDRR